MPSERDSFYKNHIEPLLMSRDSETWHVRARQALHLSELSPLTLRLASLFAHKHARYVNPRLETSIGGGDVVLENPVLVGAGWDKVGNAVAGLHALGFAGAEVGTVLAQAQTGNPKPRQFMVAPGVALNRMGFNSPGMHVVARNLEHYKGKGIPIGVSIGKNKELDAEYAPGAHALAMSVLYGLGDYFVVNVSSPNTPGLRDLQQKGPLTNIVHAVHETMDFMGKRKPLFVKIAPELTKPEIDDVIDVIFLQGLAGIVAVNTSTNADIKARYGGRWANESGGISGADDAYRTLALETVRYIADQTAGVIEIIGVGGISTAAHAWEHITAGASAVQVVTAIRSEGPAVAGKINRGLIQIMDRLGVRTLKEAVGSARR